MGFGISKADAEEAKLTIWARMMEGDSDPEIIDLLGLDAEAYQNLKRQLLDQKAAELRGKPPEHVYVEYIVLQQQNINDLTRMIQEFKHTKQYNAMVGAIRARADLYDRLIEKGQEFGVFRKTPERREIVAGFMVADMTSEALKGAITKAIGDLATLTKRYGDNDIINVLPSAIHYGPTLASTDPEVGHAPVAPRAKAPSTPPAAPPSKHARAKMSKTTKANRGRRPFGNGNDI